MTDRHLNTMKFGLPSIVIYAYFIILLCKVRRLQFDGRGRSDAPTTTLIRPHRHNLNTDIDL